MTKRCFALFAAIAVICVSVPVATANDVASVDVGPVFGEQPAPPQALQTHGPAPAALRLSCPTCPRLYNNTNICTVDVQSLAVGGDSSPPPALSLRDWFTCAGGEVTGFDLFVVNGGPGAIGNDIFPLQFFEGTDATNMGIALPAGFSTRTSPRLPGVPAYQDAETGEPRVMRVSVDYVGRTYSIVDAETEELIRGPADIGLNRVAFTLPPGKIGVDVRFNTETSLCAGGTPVCGVALASGGSGCENAIHITNATQCREETWKLVCDNFEWAPTDPPPDPQTPGIPRVPVPCVGGNVCSLNRPFFGMALVLYVGAGEEPPCNNERASASVIMMERPTTGDPPESCSRKYTFTVDEEESDVINGYVGDNGCSYDPIVVDFFDCDEDGYRDLRDLGCFQVCFGRPSPLVEPCPLIDHDQDEDVDLGDYYAWFICTLFPSEPPDPLCSGNIFPPPNLLQDIDLYEVRNLQAGDVLSVLVEGDKNPNTGPVWDPYLKIFQDVGGSLVELAVSDDYERLSFDAYTTVKVPSGATELYIGISAAENKNYPTDDPTAIPAVAPDQAGGYGITLVLTDPDCVEDDDSGGPFDCYFSRHEPDDSMEEADALGSICDPNAGCPLSVIGMIGDGAFSGTGQDVDIFKIELNGQLANTRSVVAEVADERSVGYPTEFDVAIALYDSSGELIATGDQQRRDGLNFDDSRPGLGAKALGSAFPESDGIYYLAVFGTDRGLFDAACGFIFPPVPPTLLNFPHGAGVAATSDSDLRPTVGGRANKPLVPIEGCAVPPDEPAREQCYSLILLTDTFPLPSEAPFDLCETQNDDSIPFACTSNPTDRLASMVFREFHLGNGKYGLIQGDADFYSINASPGEIIAANVSNVANLTDLERQTETVRSYLSLFDMSGFIIAGHDYSLESWDSFAYDGISDEIAAAIAGEMPSGIGVTAYLMVGIDTGNMLRRENTPFDASVPGTTLSRRFLANLVEPREYRLGVAVMPKLGSLPGGERMFVVPKRGLDDFHTSCELNTRQDRTNICHPRILEIDPITGLSEKVLDGAPFFSPYRDPGGFLLNDEEVASSNLLIAWDGEILWVAEEECAEPVLCETQIRYLFKLRPDEPRTSTSYIDFVGQIFGFPQPGSKFRGMAELNGYLYMMDDETNSFRYWNKTLAPASTNGGNMTPTPSDEEDDPRWNDLYGDIGTDGTRIYVGCTWNVIDPVTEEVLAVGEYGICAFTPDPGTGEITYNGKLDDPITNADFDPGPRLGGLDALVSGMIVTSDLNSGIMEYWTDWVLNDPEAIGSIQATELLREYQVARITAR